MVGPEQEGEGKAEMPTGDSRTARRKSRGRGEAEGKEDIPGEAQRGNSGRRAGRTVSSYEKGSDSLDNRGRCFPSLSSSVKRGKKQSAEDPHLTTISSPSNTELSAPYSPVDPPDFPTSS